MSIKLSAIIVNWNTKRDLESCLISFYNNAPSCNYEVILVDNASTDDSVSMVEGKFPDVIIHKNAANLGFAKACNQGISISKGDYVLLMNADIVVLEKTIEKLINFADLHPNAYIFGCRILNPDRSLDQSCFMFPSVLNLVICGLRLNRFFPNNRFFGRPDMTWWNAQDERPVQVVKGCFMLVRRKLFSKIGMLDEDYFMYAEESDFCYRSQKASCQVMFTPSAEVIHLGGQSTRQLFYKMKVQYYKSYLLFIKKHKGNLSYLVAVFFTSLFVLLRLPVYLCASIRNGLYKDGMELNG